MTRHIPSPATSLCNEPPGGITRSWRRSEVAPAAGSNRRLRLRIAGDAALSTFATFKNPTGSDARSDHKASVSPVATCPPGDANQSGGTDGAMGSVCAGGDCACGGPVRQGRLSASVCVCVCGLEERAVATSESPFPQRPGHRTRPHSPDLHGCACVCACVNYTNSPAKTDRHEPGGKRTSKIE